MISIFISYAREDERLAQSLAVLLGPDRVFLSTRSRREQRFKRRGPEGPPALRIVVPILSQKALVSSWVREEVKAAADNDDCILALLRADVGRGGVPANWRAALGSALYIEESNAESGTGFMERLKGEVDLLATRGPSYLGKARRVVLRQYKESVTQYCSDLQKLHGGRKNALAIFRSLRKTQVKARPSRALVEPSAKAPRKVLGKALGNALGNAPAISSVWRVSPEVHSLEAGALFVPPTERGQRRIPLLAFTHNFQERRDESLNREFDVTRLIMETLERGHREPSIEGLTRVFHPAFRSLGFSHLCVSRTDPSGNVVFDYGAGPQASHRVAGNGGEARAGVLIRLMSLSSAPIIWSDEGPQHFSGNERASIEGLHAFGAEDCYVAPHFELDGSVAATILASPAPISVDPKMRVAVHLLAGNFYNLVRGRFASSVGEPEIALSTRQLECLHWVRSGKRDDEIATILQISPSTVRHHILHACEKLGVRKRSEAIAKISDKSGWRLREDADARPEWSKRLSWPIGKRQKMTVFHRESAAAIAALTDRLMSAASLNEGWNGESQVFETPELDATSS